MVVDWLLYGFLVFGAAKLLNASAFKRKPASRSTSWALVALVFFWSLIFLSLLKTLRFQYISDSIGTPVAPTNSFDFGGALVMALLFLSLLKRENLFGRPSTAGKEWIGRNIADNYRITFEENAPSASMAFHTHNRSHFSHGWVGIGLAATSLLVLWLFSPHDRDRWVTADGHVACSKEQYLEHIQDMSTALSQRLVTDDAIKANECVLVLANERVRLLEMSTDGARAKVILKRGGNPMWMAVVALKSESNSWGTVPWLWPEDRVVSPQEESAETRPELKTEFELTDDEFRAQLEAIIGQPQSPALHATDDGGSPRDTWSRVAVRPWLSIELPSTWQVNSREFAGRVAAWMEKRGVSGEPAADSFMAQMVTPDGGPSIAHMNIRFYPELRVLQEHTAKLSVQDILDFDAALKEGLTKQSLFKVLEWLGTKSETINGLRFLVTEYVRGAVPGDPAAAERNVRLFRAFNGPQSFTITVSYGVDAAVIGRPIVDRIARSVTIVDSSD